MLKKLYKHEFYSLFRNLLPIYIGLFLFSVIYRVTEGIYLDYEVFEVINALSLLTYIFLILAVFILGAVIVITRFYKNLLSREGYLTFSLPFTATQHIVCKMICAAVVMTINLILVIVSLMIIALNDEVISGIVTLFAEFKTIFNEYTLDVILIALELVLLLVISLFNSILMFYASMAIGQKFKNKIGGSVLGYFILYFINQIINTFITVFFSTASYIGEANDLQFEKIDEIVLIKTSLLIYIIYVLIFTLSYFFLTRHLLTKKLNLE